MTSIELQLCDIQGRLFKLSVQRGINSTEFIKVFMKSATAKVLDSTYNRMQWAGEKLAPVKVMKQNYERLYMITPEEVIEKLKEKIKYVYGRR